MAPLSRRVAAAGHAGIDRKLDPDAIDGAMFFDESNDIRGLFAALIGADDPERVALQSAASYGIATVARNTRLEPGQNVVMLAEQFPSNVYSWHRLAETNGAALRTVAAPDGPSQEPRGARWNADILAAIDEATGLVALPNHHWSDGTRFDLPSIGEKARRVGAMFVVDGTQSVGAVPFDVGQVGCDALISAAYKTLYGPYSAALAWFGPRFDDGVPLEENWLMRAGSEDFANLVNYRHEYQPGAIRYDVGERSNFALNPMTKAALEEVTARDPQRYQVYCQKLTSGLEARLAPLGFTMEESAWRSSHLFGLRSAAVEPKKVQAALASHGVSVSVRGNAIRVSPGIYNDEEDIDALVDALSDAAR